MGNWLPFVLFAVVVIGLIAFSTRARRRQRDAADARVEAITVGTEVMTTSGLYGTVVARNDDDSAQLRIAPGIEVKWAFAALRDVASLPQTYQRAATGPAAAADVKSIDAKSIDAEPADAAGADKPVERE